MTPSRAALAALTALSLAACGARTTYLTIRHPLQVGAVDPNDVPFENAREERSRQLPAGTLVDRAQLLTLTPDQICVRVSVWGDQLRPQRADPNAYRIVLLNDQPGVENGTGQIQLEAPQTASYPGVRREHRYTGGYGASASSTPFVYQITYQPAVLCFANSGFVTPSTTHLTLELSDAGAGNRINFEWELASSIAR